MDHTTFITGYSRLIYLLLIINVVQPTYVRISSRCDSDKNMCFRNCQTLVNIDGKDVIGQVRGLTINLIAIPSDIKMVSYLTIPLEDNLYNSSVAIERSRRFAYGVAINSTLIIITQGCAILPTHLKHVLLPLNEEIANFRQFSRINVFVNCKGTCPVEAFTYTKDENVFERELRFALVSVSFHSVCGKSIENCHKNCKSSIRLNGEQLIGGAPWKGLALLIASVKLDDYYHDITNGRNRSHGYVLRLENVTSFDIQLVKEFLHSIDNNSAVFMMTQGCGILPDRLKVVISTWKNDRNRLFSDGMVPFHRVNIFIGCSGKCPFQSTFYTGNEQEYSGKLRFSVKSHCAVDCSRYNDDDDPHCLSSKSYKNLCMLYNNICSHGSFGEEERGKCKMMSTLPPFFGKSTSIFEREKDADIDKTLIVALKRNKENIIFGSVGAFVGVMAIALILSLLIVKKRISCCKKKENRAPADNQMHLIDNPEGTAVI